MIPEVGQCFDTSVDYRTRSNKFYLDGTKSFRCKQCQRKMKKFKQSGIWPLGRQGDWVGTDPLCCLDMLILTVVSEDTQASHLSIYFTNRTTYPFLVTNRLTHLD